MRSKVINNMADCTVAQLVKKVLAKHDLTDSVTVQDLNTDLGDKIIGELESAILRAVTAKHNTITVTVELNDDVNVSDYANGVSEMLEQDKRQLGDIASYSVTGAED